MREPPTAGLGRDQSIRLRRFHIASISYALWFVIGLSLDALGHFQLNIGGLRITGLALVFGIIGTQTLFYVLLKTGANLRFDDPSLSLPMMLVAVFWGVLFTAGIPVARGIGLLGLMTVFLFGVFSLNRRQYLVCWATTLVAYTAAIYLSLPADVSAAQLRLEAVHVVLVALVLFWTVYFGHYVGQLRDRLAARNSELKRALSLVEELAVHDDLTGLHNRRFVMETLQREQQRALRSGTRFSLLLLDIDRFKEINDSYGHQAGDAVLQGFVKRMRESVRDFDVVAQKSAASDGETLGRFGGEEFMMVLPDTGLEGARVVAERVRASVAQQPISTPAGPVDVTVSIGVAEYFRGETVRDTLERVDRALYAAKHAGRNCLGIAPSKRDEAPAIYVAGVALPISTDNGR